ncbi:hypothetical protein BDY21DRAFT_335893, partial [Lineolata rhizophorae]
MLLAYLNLSAVCGHSFAPSPLTVLCHKLAVCGNLVSAALTWRNFEGTFLQRKRKKSFGPVAVRYAPSRIIGIRIKAEQSKTRSACRRYVCLVRVPGAAAALASLCERRCERENTAGLDLQGTKGLVGVRKRRDTSWTSSSLTFCMPPAALQVAACSTFLV